VKLRVGRLDDKSAHKEEGSEKGEGITSLLVSCAYKGSLLHYPFIEGEKKGSNEDLST